jgi:hypothetical protein
MNNICNGLLNVGDLGGPNFVNECLHLFLADLSVIVQIELIKHPVELFIVKSAPFTSLGEILSDEWLHLKLRKQAGVILVIGRPYLINEAPAGRLGDLSLVLNDQLIS